MTRESWLPEGSSSARPMPPTPALPREEAAVAVRAVKEDKAQDKGRTFASGATRDTANGKLELHRYFSPKCVRRFAEYMQQHQIDSNGNYRPGNNWQKGMPREVFVASMFRHFLEVWERWDDIGGLDNPTTEDALCAIIFNAQGLLLELLLGRNLGGV
jgi:hypothetical protein